MLDICNIDFPLLLFFKFFNVFNVCYFYYLIYGGIVRKTPCLSISYVIKSY